MSKEWKNVLLKYGISLVLVVLMIALYLSGRDISGATLLERYRIFCDAFFIPAILFLMVACLVWASTKGAMDGISFLTQNLIRSLIPGGRIRTSQKYYDYLEERKEKRKVASSYRFLFVIGGICLVISLVFLYLFYQAK